MEPLQVTMDEAARLMSMTRRSLEKMIAAGAVASHKIGRRRYVTMAEVRRVTRTETNRIEPAVVGPVVGPATETTENILQFRTVS